MQEIQILIYADENGNEPFTVWIHHLKDISGRKRIFTRIDRLKYGNYGDCEPVGEGVHELRMHFGPGYRVYFAEKGTSLLFYFVVVTKAIRNSVLKTLNSIGRSYRNVRNLRTFDEFKEDYFREHPEEIDEFITIIFDEYAKDGDIKALLASLRTVSRVKGITAIAEETGISRNGIQKALSENGNPYFESINAILHAIGFRLMPQRI